MQNGPAGEGGMRPGDVVTEVASTPVKNTAQLLSAVAALKPKDSARIAVQRGSQTLELSVVVAQRPRAPLPKR